MCLMHGRMDDPSVSGVQLSLSEGREGEGGGREGEGAFEAFKLSNQLLLILPTNYISVRV